MVIINNIGNNSKQKSRFDVLNNDNKSINNTRYNTKPNTKINTNTKSKSNANKTQNKNNMFTDPNYKYTENIEMDIPELNLGLEQFPELGNNKQNNIKTQENKEYLKKLRQQNNNNIKIIDKDLENLDYGWVLLKRNNDNRKTIFKEHPNTQKHNTPPLEKIETETENVIINNIFEQLVNNHEIRTQEYIDNWGYDEWEQTFKFHNWLEEEQFWNDEYITDDDNSVCSDDYIDDY
jgi:hypothetical protein